MSHYSAFETTPEYPLKIYYGVAETNTDITQTVFSKCKMDNYLVIPPDDNFRAKLFGDPLFGKVKQLILFGLMDSLVFVPNDTGMLINLTTLELIRDVAQVRKYVYKLVTKHAERLQWIHRFIKLDHGSMMEEFPEQNMVLEYLTGDARVLEIGANIGRNSLVISSILKNDENLVCLECSPSISAQLRHNRDKNGARFQIETAALSARRLFQRGWRTVPATSAEEPCPEGYQEVPTITYERLMSKYCVEFDTLVLDCEGAFYYILRDTPQILDGIRTIIVENDYSSLEQKKYVDEVLISRGFRAVYQDTGNAEAAMLKMPCLENFYEVWKYDEEAFVGADEVGAEVGAEADMETDVAQGAAAVATRSEPISQHALFNVSRSTPLTAPIYINFMKRYPCVYFLRHDRYSAVDSLFLDVSNTLMCAVIIINADHASELRNMVDPNYPILVTYGKQESEYTALVNRHIVDRMRRRWFHRRDIPSLKQFVYSVNYCYIDNVLHDRVATRPVFSIFTTCYKSFDKIERAYASICSQRLRDWEWVITDDSPSDDHFSFLRRRFSEDPRIRLYRRSENSGNIGNVKNEAVSLCRGKYILEMDHDDEILPDTLADATRTFDEDSTVGFVYMDFINIYPNGRNFFYGDFISLGYGGYYNQKFRGKWAYLYVTPNINNITLSHIVSVPNHPRIWRAEVLHRIGNYSEFLPICDDLEVLMRTAMVTKMAKIPKLAYVQYMNENNNNFSLIRNGEINRLTPQFIVPQFYERFKVHEVMKGMGGYDNEKYLNNHSRIWMRDDYTPRFCNKVVQYDYDKQYCIIGVDSFYANLAFIEREYKNPRNDFFLLTGTGDREELWALLDKHGFERMKCYSLKDTAPKYLIQYFKFLCCSCEKYEILFTGSGDEVAVSVEEAMGTDVDATLSKSVTLLTEVATESATTEVVDSDDEEGDENTDDTSDASQPHEESKTDSEIRSVTIPIDEA